MNNKSEIYIVILNWNGTADTIACLQSLRLMDGGDYQTVLVDNDSEEEAYNELKQWCANEYSTLTEYTEEKNLGQANDLGSDHLIIIRNKENLGFAAGNNVAIDFILSQSQDPYVLLLNNDTVVESQFLNHLSAFMKQNNEYVACTPQIRYYEPNDKIWSCGGHIRLGNRMSKYRGASIENIPTQGYEDITFITGCALFFRPRKTGKLSEKFFFGEEDFEFSLRLRKHKQKVACVFDSIIYHKVSQTVAKDDNTFNRMFLFYAMRFIDYKPYYSIFIRPLLIVVNLLSASRILLRERMPLQRMILFVSKLLRFVRMNNEVRKDAFNMIMRMTF